MKRTSSSKSREDKTEEMLPEYSFDYSKAQRNRFATEVAKDRIVVALDPDVSEVFTTPESVNKVLRALITNMPKGVKRKNYHK